MGVHQFCLFPCHPAYRGKVYVQSKNILFTPVTDCAGEPWDINYVAFALQLHRICGGEVGLVENHILLLEQLGEFIYRGFLLGSLYSFMEEISNQVLPVEYPALRVLLCILIHIPVILLGDVKESSFRINKRENKLYVFWLYAIDQPKLLCDVNPLAELDQFSFIVEHCFEFYERAAIFPGYSLAFTLNSVHFHCAGAGSAHPGLNQYRGFANFLICLWRIDSGDYFQLLRILRHF